MRGDRDRGAALPTLQRVKNFSAAARGQSHSWYRAEQCGRKGNKKSPGRWDGICRELVKNKAQVEAQNGANVIPFICAPALDSFPHRCNSWFWEESSALQERGALGELGWGAGVMLYSQDVGDDPDGPAVHGFAVGLLGQHFGGCSKTKGQF